MAGSEGLRLGCLGAGRGAAALPMLVPSWIYTLRALPHGSTAQCRVNAVPLTKKEGGQPCALRLAAQQSSQCLWPAHFMVQLVDGHDNRERSAEGSSFRGSVHPVCLFEAELVHTEVVGEDVTCACGTCGWERLLRFPLLLKM